MANNRNSYNQPSRILMNVLAAILILAVLVGCTLGGLQLWGKGKVKPSNWGKPDVAVEQPNDDDKDKDNDENGGAVLTPGDETGEGTGNKIALTMEQFDLSKMSLGEREEYGIMPLAETAFTVTATVNGEDLTDGQKNVTWSAAAFKNPSSSWATGKSVGTYVTATPSGNKLTVSCLKAFGEQIVVTATSTFNSAVSKQLTIDYKEKIEFTGVTINSKNMTGTVTETLNITGDRNATVVGSFSHSDAYTIKGDTVTAVVKLTRSSDLTTAVTSTYATRFPEYTVTVTSASPNGTINDYFDKETHNKIFLEGYPTTFTAANMATVYNGLKTMNTSSQAQYTVAATVTGASSNSSAQQKSLGSLKLSFTEIQTWYEAFTNLSIDFGSHNGGIVF